MIRTPHEAVSLSASRLGVASGIYGFALDVKAGQTGPFLAFIRYEGSGADEPGVIYPGRWYGGSRRMERVQLATLTETADVYVTTGNHPDDLVTETAPSRATQVQRVYAQFPVGYVMAAGPNPAGYVRMDLPAGCRTGGLFYESPAYSGTSYEPALGAVMYDATGARIAGDPATGAGLVNFKTLPSPGAPGLFCGFRGAGGGRNVSGSNVRTDGPAVPFAPPARVDLVAYMGAGGGTGTLTQPWRVWFESWD